MTTKRRRALCIAISFVLAITCCSCAVQVKQVDITNDSESLISTVSHFENKKADIELLNESYFESDSLAYFNSKNHYNTYAYDFNLYRLANYLRICEVTGHVKSNTILLDNIPDFCTAHHASGEIMDLEDNKLVDIIYLEKLCQFDCYEAKEKQYLEKRFDAIISKDVRSDPETIMEMNQILTCFVLLGVIPELNQKAANDYFTNLIHDDEYFTLSDKEMDKNVFSGGMVILENCDLYNKIIGSQNVDISSRNEWFSYWVSVFEEYLQNESATLMIMNTGLSHITSISKTYGIDICIDSYERKLKKVNWKELLAIDPKIVYECLNILDAFGYDMPKLSTELINYTQFLYNFTPEIILSEQYYGYLLSRILKYEINTPLFLETMEKYFLTRTSAKDYYYFMRINYESDNTETFKSHYSKRYQDFINSSIETIKDVETVEDIFFILSICKEFNVLDQNSIKNIVAELNLQLDELSLEQEVYWYSRILRLCGETHQDVFAKTKLFYSQGGYMVTEEHAETVNLYSTYRMLNLELSTPSNNSNIVFSKKDLSAYRGCDGGYFLQHNNGIITDYRDNFTMQSWLYGIMLFDALSS